MGSRLPIVYTRCSGGAAHVAPCVENGIASFWRICGCLYGWEGNGIVSTPGRSATVWRPTTSDGASCRSSARDFWKSTTGIGLLFIALEPAAAAAIGRFMANRESLYHEDG